MRSNHSVPTLLALISICLLISLSLGCDGIFADLDDIEATDAGDDGTDADDNFKTCEELDCEYNQECVESAGEDAFCQCKDGFVYDRETCVRDGDCEGQENACGGCSSLPGEPQSSCDICDYSSGAYACDGTDDVICEVTDETIDHLIDDQICCIEGQRFDNGDWYISDDECFACNPDEDPTRWSTDDRCAYQECLYADSCSGSTFCIRSGEDGSGEASTGICRPSCDEHADCPAPAKDHDGEASCHLFESESFCYLSCDHDADCPDGLKCSSVTSEEGSFSTCILPG